MSHNPTILNDLTQESEMRNPSWYEDPPEDPPEDDETQPIEYGEGWDTPTNYPHCDPDYQAEQDRRHDRK